MTDKPDAPASANETPAQKALRLKQAKLAARSQPGSGFKLTQEARPKAGTSKPWMTR
ncbi:hypothetical protein [Brevundimonas vesicularis]|uniref:hypothetical protein n=1 Tax=Brevundimonas vesicularis TaxID=41276 RepID=UPI0038D49C8D